MCDKDEMVKALKDAVQCGISQDDLDTLTRIFVSEDEYILLDQKRQRALITKWIDNGNVWQIEEAARVLINENLYYCSGEYYVWERENA